MREFCIVTVYNSSNLGSYLQAKALADYLSRYGEVYFLNTNSRHPEKSFIKNAAKAVLAFDFKLLSFEIKRHRTFKSVQKTFKVIEAKDCTPNMTFIFGSDEIWNIKRKEMNQYPVFWGEGLSGAKISYGVSVNQTSKEDMNSWPYKSNLTTFKAISVRDKWSRQLIENYTNKSVSEVVDPTMLFERDYYIGSLEKKNLTNYIAVYTFGHRMDKERIAIVKEIGRQLGKKIVGVGLYCDWCDECYISDNSFEYFVDASLTVVNTFHGTVFSILLQKQFIAFADSNKVRNLLSDFGLESRNVADLNLDEVKRLLDKDISYSTVNAILERKRKQSKKFLTDALDL